MTHSKTSARLPLAPKSGAMAGLRECLTRREKPVLAYAENIHLPVWVWGLFLVVALYGGLFTANTWLTAASIIVLPIFISLLWFHGEPPVLVFACVMQWLQASVAVFYTNYNQLSLAEAFGGPELAQATWLSLVAVLVLAAGMRLALMRRPAVAEQASQESAQLVAGKIFPLYLAAFVFFYFLSSAAYALPAIRQPLLATAALRWVLLILLAYAVIHQRRGYGYLVATVVLEVAVGLLSFFSGFKEVFFVLAVVLAGRGGVFRGWRLLQLAGVGALIVALMTVWSVIKSDYREFLNQGSAQQVVMVTVSEQVDKLGELVGGLDGPALEAGLNDLILRVSYVNYFAFCLKHVPDNVPHEHGALWFGAVTHVLMPRFLFPNKAVLDDSERTQYYTGVSVAGAETGTSIGIGYVGESYVDFGRWGMFAPILLLGAVYGFIYRTFLLHPQRIVGIAIAAAILIFGAFSIETSNVKLLGGNLMCFIVMLLFAKFFGHQLWDLIAHSHRIIARPRGRSRRRTR